jgi:hypothetical protein
VLDKESPETKRRIAAKVREQFDLDPTNPQEVTEGMMLFFRHDRS